MSCWGCRAKGRGGGTLKKLKRTRGHHKTLTGARIWGLGYVHFVLIVSTCLYVHTHILMRYMYHSRVSTKHKPSLFKCAILHNVSRPDSQGKFHLPSHEGCFKILINFHERTSQFVKWHNSRLPFFWNYIWNSVIQMRCLEHLWQLYEAAISIFRTKMEKNDFSVMTRPFFFKKRAGGQTAISLGLLISVYIRCQTPARLLTLKI